MNSNVYGAVIGLSIIISIVWSIIFETIVAINSGCQVKIPSNEYLSYHTDNRTLYNNGSTNLCTTGISCFRRCSFEGFVYKREPACRPVPELIERNGSFTELAPYYITDDISLKHLCYPEQDYCLLTTRKAQFEPSTCGSLFITQGNTTITMKYNEYCFLNDSAIFYCNDRPFTPYVAFIGMIISMPFLLVTFLVYAILPESNIHRRSLMCYVLSLLIGYIFLVSIQLNNNFIETFWCHFLGYGIIFFFICSFFWMNVMCIDMWLAFSGLRGFKGKRSTERKRFLAYFAYAVGMPLLLIFIVFLMNTYADEDSIFHPKLGGARCFVEEGYPNLFYFSLPMAIILLINVILFILTSVRIQQVKKETSMLKQSDSKRHTYEEEKQKFNLYLKLSLAMGINWIMEVISWAVGWKLKTVPGYIWYLTDFTNAAYGVLIFFIFVFKKKIWVGLKKKYYVFIGKPHLAHTLSTSHPARTSNYSTTDTAVSTDYRLSDVKNGKGEDRPLSRN